jgi:Flp pilus assembly protein TadG
MTRRDDGSVTIEAALGLAALTVLAVLLLAALTIVTAQLHCTDAAREAARLLARGQPAQAEEAVHQIAPPGATFDVQHTGEEITVKVAAHPAGDFLPAINLKATAYALAEPGTDATR